MKFRILHELFTSIANRNSHHQKHVLQQKQFKYSVEDYEERADALSRKTIDNKRIFGYRSLTREGKIANCKYDKDTEEFVVYTVRNGEPFTITMYKKSWREYTGDKGIEYYDEIVE